MGRQLCVEGKCGQYRGALEPPPELDFPKLILVELTRARDKNKARKYSPGGKIVKAGFRIQADNNYGFGGAVAEESCGGSNSARWAFKRSRTCCFTVACSSSSSSFALPAVSWT